ncbi:glycosyltransferase family 4 protein [Chromobacterium aquaticum]|uniref:Glycosyltransferase family 4 protein n=1 Tax=Chromobacterium aquaticum TaxID=467180 RepID=A0ABV8ZZB0_9NEIS|nr:glycosyltransferase family 4 protein [Chromobacterium aquaticum]MCD5363709.1 glycosyltransferase family 4 protein [Chromobacterium aquaticum]
MAEPLRDKIASIAVIGSASVHTWRFLRGIAPHVEQVYLACNGEAPADVAALLAGSLRVDFRLAALGTVARLRAWLRETRPQLLHIHQANSVAWHGSRAAASLDLPTVLTAWGSDVLLLPERNRLMRAMVRANLGAADAITSDSLHMAAKIRELAGEGCRIRLLNYGIDALPASAASAGKGRTVLSCRLHKPLYRIDAILRAWQRVERSGRFGDWRLSVAASGSETEALKRLAAELGLSRVDFAGFVDSATLGRMYAESRVFVSVPRSDATSISLLEAMGHGCLPLLSNLPANGEWVIDGLNGVIAEDVGRLGEELLRAMELAGDDARLDEVAALNRRLVADKGLHQANMAGFAQLYRELLNPDH